MCYALEEEKALFTGDHVMGWSTSVIAPPDGNMGDYMRSLEKLIARDDAILYPTHGSPIADPEPLLRAYLTHRRMREAQIAGCLARGDRHHSGDCRRSFMPGFSPRCPGRLADGAGASGAYVGRGQGRRATASAIGLIESP